MQLRVYSRAQRNSGCQMLKPPRFRLLDQPRIRFHRILAINPASLLLDDDPEEPLHDCLEVIDFIHTASLDLTDTPLASPDKVLFTDGSSFVQEGISCCLRLNHLVSVTHLQDISKICQINYPYSCSLVGKGQVSKDLY